MDSTRNIPYNMAFPTSGLWVFITGEPARSSTLLVLLFVEAYNDGA
jgi:hypothetical protein